MPDAPAAAVPSLNTRPTAATSYLIDGILPRGEVSILSGASGVGKSTLLMQLVKAIQAGEDGFWGHQITHPVRVAYVAADRTWAAYCELAERVGMDLNRIQVVSVVDDDGIDPARLERDSLELLFSLISRFDKPDLVIIDPLIVFLGCDTNNYSKVAPRLIKINRWCRHNHFTILGTHHATKARTDYGFKRAQDRVSGSSAILGFTSTQLFLAGADEIGQPFSEWHIVPHNRPAEVIRLARDEHGLLARWQGEDLNQPLVRAILEAVTIKPLTKPALMAATRIDPATLDGLLDHLVAAQAIKANRRGEFGIVTADARRH